MFCDSIVFYEFLNSCLFNFISRRRRRYDYLCWL